MNQINFTKRDITKLLKLHKAFFNRKESPGSDVLRFQRSGDGLLAVTGSAGAPVIETLNPCGIDHGGGDFCWDIQLSALAKSVSSAKAGDTLTLTEATDLAGTCTGDIELHMPSCVMVLPPVEAHLASDGRGSEVLGMFPAAELRDALARVSHCAARKEVRAYLNGVWLQFKNNKLSCLYALDGHRFGVVEFGDGRLDDCDLSVLISAAGAPGLIAALAAAPQGRDALITARRSDGDDNRIDTVRFGLGDQHITCPVPDVNPIGVAHVPPADDAPVWGTLKADCGELADALAQMRSAIGGSAEKSVRLVSADGGVELQGRVSERGHSTSDTPADAGVRIKVAADTSGGFKPVSFSLEYLHQAAKSAVATGGGRLRLRVLSDWQYGEDEQRVYMDSPGLGLLSRPDAESEGFDSFELVMALRS